MFFLFNGLSLPKYFYGANPVFQSAFGAEGLMKKPCPTVRLGASTGLNPLSSHKVGDVESDR
jgi:hypothetical protein